MKIRKLKIKNYKIFDDVEFDFTDAEGKTLDTVVLAGVNGCGKTTVLEVIGLILSIKRSLWGINGELEKAEIEIIVELTHTEEVETMMSQLAPGSQNSDGYYTFGLKSTLNHTLPQKTIYLPVSEKTEDTEKVKILHLARQKDEMKHIVLKNLRDEVFENRNLPPQQAIITQIKNVTSALSELDLNTRLVDFKSEELVFESANGQRIYFEQLSHGEQHLYFRAIYLSQLNLKDSIIMVDEPEAAFHPKWQQQITQLYNNLGENNQVFLATHSPHIMASVPPECLFMLHIDESEDRRKIHVVNAAKAGKHSQGLEPDRILKEIMQVEALRDYKTQRDINELTKLLTLEAFESERAVELAEKLTKRIGREDPFIILLEHELLMLRRKKRTLAFAEA